MRRNCVVNAVFNVAVLLTLIGLSLPTHAQTGGVSEPAFDPVGGRTADGVPTKVPNPLPKAQPTPRTTEGHPDLSGVWFVGYTGTNDIAFAGTPYQRRFDPKVTPQEAPSFQPWVALKQKRIGPSNDAEPCLTCDPLGVPGFIIKNPYPIEIVQTQKELVILAELDTTYRTIWTDGRNHQKDPDPTFNGDAVGHWEGDTLVVDVTAIDTHTWLTGPGANLAWFPSDVMHVIERFSRPDSNTLLYQVTVEDPKILTKPWTLAPNHYSIGQVPRGEYYCSNNKDVDQFNAAGAKYISPTGLDERYFDEQEYQELKKEAADKEK